MARNLREKIKYRNRQQARVDRVGTTGVNIQNSRDDGSARAAVKRVGEYKRGKVDKADGNNAYINRKSQENLK